MIGCARAASQRQLILLADQKIGSTAGSQSYTIPSGTQYIDIELYGAGGGGAASRQFSSAKQFWDQSGGGGGGGAYVRYGYTGAYGGDVLNFVIGSAGTGGTYDQGAIKKGTSGGNTSLTSLVRGSTTVVSFSGVIAHGGFGGEASDSTVLGGPGGTGGVGIGGNITNRNGNAGQYGTVDANDNFSELSGGYGGSGARNDEILSGSKNGGTGGAGSYDIGSDVASTVGGNAIADLTNLVGAGGGGGGGFPGTTPSTKGATGGLGGIRIRSYG